MFKRIFYILKAIIEIKTIIFMINMKLKKMWFFTKRWKKDDLKDR